MPDNLAAWLWVGGGVLLTAVLALALAGWTVQELRAARQDGHAATRGTGGDTVDPPPAAGAPPGRAPRAPRDPTPRNRP